MSYESYYENMSEYPDQKPPRRGGRIAMTIIIVAVVFFISGLLIAGLIQSARQQPAIPFLPTPGFDSTPAPQPSRAPVPTPLPTERPMPALDGTTPVLPQTGNPIPDIVDAVSPSVVGVINYARSGGEMEAQGMGSGFFISSEGYVLTNAHVVQGAEELTITLLNGKELDAELIAKDDIGDVAVLLVRDAQVAPLKLGDSDSIRVGEYVLTMGNPLGRNYEGTATMGIISARSRNVMIEGQSNSYIQTDAAINVGSSGGPLINMQGEVVGINTAKTINAGYDENGMAISAEGLGFALPINTVRIIAEQLITKGYVEHAALGVYIRTVTRQEMTEFDLDYGIYIDTIVRGGPADNAGLLASDIILAYDGIHAEKQDALVNYVGSLPVGAMLNLDILRDGEEMSIQVHLVDQTSLDFSDVVSE